MSKRRPASTLLKLHPALSLIVRRLGQALPLTLLSERTGLSRFHFQRVFASVVGESPKQYTRRLRLSDAAARLLAGDEPIVHIALSCGFESHEGFTRAFSQRFGMSPHAYRARGFSVPTTPAQAAAHAAIVREVGPCVGLLHASDTRSAPNQRSDMSYTIVKKELAPQRVLLARRRVARPEIAATIGAVMAQLFQYAQQHGRALTGHPITRYVEFGPGMVTIEPGMRVVDSGRDPAPSGTTHKASASNAGEVIEETLPGGPAVTTIHEGPYDRLMEAYAALQIWIAAHGLEEAGPFWEDYLTDPGDYPDPKDWKTEVCWPVRTKA